MFCDGEPKRQEEEENHEEQVDECGEFDANSEEHHEAERELNDVHADAAKHWNRLQKAHAKRDKIVIKLYGAGDRVDGFRESRKDENAPQ